MAATTKASKKLPTILQVPDGFWGCIEPISLEFLHDTRLLQATTEVIERPTS